VIRCLTGVGLHREAGVYDVSRTRNFCIIAHGAHRPRQERSTLADRRLQSIEPCPYPSSGHTTIITIRSSCSPTTTTCHYYYHCHVMYVFFPFFL
jgi:hypothetical protein